MAVLLFKLRNVPEEEAEEVRSLLVEHGIDIYETSAGNWRISMPAIWLRDELQLEQAKQLLEDYQHFRYMRAREEFDNHRAQGLHPTLWTNFRSEPLRVGAYAALVALIVYFSVSVFLGIG